MPITLEPAASCYHRLIMDVVGTVYSYAVLAIEQTCPAAVMALPAVQPPLSRSHQALCGGHTSYATEGISNDTLSGTH